MSCSFIVWTTDETSGLLFVWSKHSWRHHGQRKSPDLSNHSLIHDSWYSEGKKTLRLNKVNREYDTVYTKKWYNRYKYVFFCVCKKYDQRYFTYMYSDAICEVNVWHVRSEGNCNRINDTQSGAFWSYWYILIRTNTVT